MATLVSDIEMATINVDLTQSESERRDGARLLSKGDWIARTDGGYAITHHDDCTSILRDKRWFSALALISQMQNYVDKEWAKRGRKSILSTEGLEHQRIRRIVSPAFTPKSADRLRPFMNTVINELLDPICEIGETEFVSNICEPYPIPIICELLGAPKEDWELFSRLAEDIFKIFNGNLAEDAPVIMAAQDEMDAYMRSLIAKRKIHPQEDLLTDLIRAEEDGDRLSTDELLSMANALLLAGTDTTRNQLACAVSLFPEHPVELQKIRDNSSLAPQAVEETMRYLGAVRGTGRYASEDIEYRGILFPKDTLIFPSFVAANHDSKKFDHPNEFNITRENKVPHLTFGSGIHFCLGAFLARAELQEAFITIANRMPGLKNAGQVKWKPTRTGIWGPKELPLTFDPGF